MYHQPNEWSYYDPNQQHGMYNNTYNNYKTDYNCLNQPPPQTHQIHQQQQPSTDPSTMYNGANYNYYYQTPDPYAAAAAAAANHHQTHPHHIQADYTNINHHSNYQNNNPM
jgi:hypothetical protein